MKNEKQHLSAIRDVLSYINSKGDNPYILKGGTALSICYSLNRFSEDIDLDAAGSTVSYGRFKSEIRHFCEEKGYSYRIAKDTMTTQRAYIDYGNPGRPLKVEVSYRRKDIPEHLICNRDGIQVYTLDEMARLKAAAYNGRDKIRDLYDVAYICTHYLDDLGESARDALRAALEYKDLEQFDYIVKTQKDELIDSDVLETMFLESFDKLGLLSPESDEKPTPSEEPVRLKDEAHAMQESSKAMEAVHENQAYHQENER